MADKMLIDSSHPEETRVVVTRGSRVEEFDFEAADRKQLRGNIYLAKVIRVEPSLQAAFVDYGGNRHGFLAFSEIHPDYYKISAEDRRALLEEVAREQRSEDEEPEKAPRSRRRRRRRGEGEARAENGAASASEEAEAAASAPVETDRADWSEDDARLAPDAAEVAAQGESADAAQADAGDAQPGQAQAVEAAPAVEAPEVAPAPADEAAPSEGEAEDAPRGDAKPIAAAAVYEQDAEISEGDEPEGPQAFMERADVKDVEADAAKAAEAERRIEAEHEAAARDENGDPGEEDDEDDDEDEESKSDGDSDDDDEDGDDDGDENGEAKPAPEEIGGDAMDETPVRPVRTRRQFKIQEVIRRGQILLVQVVKEERGNKGAALTTYLSLAGRYSVLMPNTARGGGVSRKITDGDDRKRLKSIAQELEVPEGMGVIVRTAGASRTKQEIRRDFEYLMRMWETVRETTLRSTAPTLVYEEGSLIKRAIRDLYSKDIEEILVAGQDGYREAKEFMRLLMPTHARHVKLWTDAQPIFARSGVESQLDGMFSSHVTLRSGGYLVINQTEALVAIDVNSGRSTREHNIEDTALRTNLEAADEVARQLRLRDLAGLIVVDFIDMEENKNNRAVERRMKDALKNDRARIQIGRISHFGLLEMSRQRIRTGVLEGSTVPCPHCMGAGTVRATASIALHVLRIVEDALMRNAGYDIIVRTRGNVALYILNNKRANLIELEQRFGVCVFVKGDDSLTGSVYHALERGEPTNGAPALPRALMPPAEAVEEPIEEIDAEIEDEADEAEDENGGEDEAEAEDRREDGERGRRRRRRRRRGGRGASGIDADAPQPSDEALGDLAALDGTMVEGAGEESDEDENGAEGSEGQEREGQEREGQEREGREREGIERDGESAAREGRSRRRRRGRGRGRDGEEANASDSGDGAEAESAAAGTSSAPVGAWSAEPAPLHDEGFARVEDVAEADALGAGADAAPAKRAAPQPEPVALPAPTSRALAPVDATDAAPANEPAEAAPPRRAEELPEAPATSKRSGWWARAKASFTGS
jgi:ribonuclease E